MDICNIKEKLESMLPNGRLKHSYNVADCAVKLSEVYNCDKDKAYLAGLVHDCAKYLNEEEVSYYVNKYSICLDELEQNNLNLSHSTIGEVLAKNEFNIEDEEVLGAIRYHTTGKENMNILEKIIYLADIIEESRSYKGVEELRELTYSGKLDEALLLSFNNTIKLVIDRGQIIHNRTIDARNYLVKNKNNNI